MGSELEGEKANIQRKIETSEESFMYVRMMLSLDDLFFFHLGFSG